MSKCFFNEFLIQNGESFVLENIPSNSNDIAVSFEYMDINNDIIIVDNLYSSTDFNSKNKCLYRNGKSKSGTLKQGQNLKKFSVIGRIKESGLLVECNDLSAMDGSEVPIGILMYPVNATASDSNCQFYYSGEFNSRSINWPPCFYKNNEKRSRFNGSPIIIKSII